MARHSLASAISVAAAYTQLGIFAGPALAGWLILHFGAAVAFATNVAGYGVYFGCVACLRTPAGYEQPAASGKSLVADLIQGLRAIAGHRGISGVLTLMLFGDALAAAVRQMAPALADRELGAGVEGLATLLACAGLGATLSALWLAHGGARRSTARTVTWAFLGFLAAIGVLTLSHDLISAGLSMLALGCFFEICRTGTVALLQTSVRDELRGRVMGTQFLLMRLAGAFGVAGLGVFAEDWGLRAPILCCVALALLAWAVTFRARQRIAVAFRTEGG